MSNVARELFVASDSIPQCLRTVYNPDSMIAVGATMRGNGVVTMEYCFPNYERTRAGMGHVSSMQITGALLEGGHCALEDAFRSGLFPAAATEEWYFNTLNDWLALRINTLFRRQLNFGERVNLEFRVLDIGSQRLRRRRLSATIEYDGFCSGEMTWVIDPPPGLIL